MAMDNLNKSLSTGSTWKDLMLGGIGGLASQLDKGKGNYYVMANYKGNGLADSGMGYLTNYDYKNPYDMVNMVASVWGNNKGLPSSISGRIKQGYGKLKNKLGSMFRTPELEDQGSVRQAIDREVNNYPQWYQDTPIAQAIREQNQYGKVDSVSPIYDALNTNYQPLDGTSIYY